MKYHETHYEEYIQSANHCSFHPELDEVYAQLPQHVSQLSHTILYGPTGAGKYTQMLRIVLPFSPTHLKYDKKIRVQTEKQTYSYRISDIHYEIDMGLLGCNSKTLWHELFFQIVDIVSMKPEKTGIIVCKNFHAIHNELLEVFYSYLQQTKVIRPNIHIKFLILTEHIGFIPNNIIDCCAVIPVRRPSRETYATSIVDNNDVPSIPNIHTQFIKRMNTTRLHNASKPSRSVVPLKNIDSCSIINAKEMHSFSLIQYFEDIPSDIFVLICDNIVDQLLKHNGVEFADFREHLYDILVYNLDITECLWYVLYKLVHAGHLEQTDMSAVLAKIFVFLKYYNNNYRPIYHLESIFFYLLLHIHGYTCDGTKRVGY